MKITVLGATGVIGKDVVGDSAPVVVGPSARYFGTLLCQDSLATGGDAVLASIRFADWLTAH